MVTDLRKTRAGSPFCGHTPQGAAVQTQACNGPWERMTQVCRLGPLRGARKQRSC